MAGGAAVAFSTREKLERARQASRQVAQLSSDERNDLLVRIADQLVAQEASILRANAEDLERSNLSGAMRDRLILTNGRIEEMSRAVRQVAELPDPIGEVLDEWTRPNGLTIRQVRVPLGVIGMVYESRPNVTVDAATLALKAGNAVVLRGGREAAETNRILSEIMTGVPGLPAGAIELLDSASRATVEELVRARGLVDVLIPRGGPGLISYVVENALVPVIETGAGNCHIFVDHSADLAMAARIVMNAKTQRPSVCNAAEKLLVDSSIAAVFVPQMVRQLLASGVEVRGDEAAQRLDPHLKPAVEKDWEEEYLRLCMAIRVVGGLDAAIEHINRYSTKHSDAIVTEDAENARRFLDRVDSAAVYWNASTRFTDGGEFGFGAEMGISTQKLHCRGPFALKELTSAKYQILGSGQTRS